MIYQRQSAKRRFIASTARSDSSPDKPNPPPPQPALTGSLAKWALPSVTAFVAIVGYIIQSAQQDMLGIGMEPGETTSYFISAAKFTSDTARIAIAPFIRFKLSFGAKWELFSVATLVALATLATVAIFVAPRLTRTRRLYHPVMLTALLAGLLGAKFLILDVPLARVTNVVLHDRNKLESGRKDPAPIVDSGATGSEGRVNRYAAGLINSIRCGRVNADTAKLNASLKNAPECTQSSEANRRRLIGTYNAHIWMMALIVAAAGIVLHYRPRRPERMLAYLALLYSLSIPYAYGKLISSVFFDFGTVYFTSSPAPGGAAAAPASQKVLILSRGTGGARLLLLQETDCPLSESGEQTRDAQIVQQWVPQSRIAAIEEIYPTDIVEWAAGSERFCKR